MFGSDLTGKVTVTPEGSDTYAEPTLSPDNSKRVTDWGVHTCPELPFKICNLTT